MRKTVIYCILVICILSSCTEKELDGIFDFKIGMTESQLREVVDTTLLERDLSFIDTTHKRKDLKLTHYVVNETVAINDILFIFHNDKLTDIYIEQYNPIIENLLTQKYGLNNEVNEGNKTIKIWNTGNIIQIRCGSVYTIDSIGNISYSLMLIDRRTVE